MLMNEVVIFKPNSRKKEATITSPIQAKVLEALNERMGLDMAARAKTAFGTLNRNGFEFLQFREGERRIRVRQVEA